MIVFEEHGVNSYNLLNKMLASFSENIPTCSLAGGSLTGCPASGVVVGVQLSCELNAF